MAEYEVARRLNQSTNEWETVVVDETGGGGGSQNLTDVLTEGNDGGGLGATNLGALSGTSLIFDALALSGTVLLRSGADDPSTGGGLAGPVGSFLFRTNGQAWIKTGAGNTDWTQVGGSPAGAIQVVRVPLAFDTTNLVLTGITAYTPAVGDVLLEASYLSITEAWDGSTPGIYLYSNGDAPGSGNEIIQHVSLTDTNQLQGSSTRNSIVQKEMGSMYLNASSGNHIIFDTTDALKLMVDDGASGDPVSTQGAGEFVLIIAPAA